MNKDSAILAQSLLGAHKELLYKAPDKASLYKVPNESKKAIKGLLVLLGFVFFLS